MQIKETQEAIDGVMEVSLFLIKRMKDGIGVDDVSALWDKLQDDHEFKEVIKKGYEGVSNVPAELKDIDLVEGTQLGIQMIGYVPRIIMSLKKD